MNSSIGSAAVRGPHHLRIGRQVSNHTFIIESPKADLRRIIVESENEAAAVYAFEGDPNVITITEQPLRIPVSKPGSPYTTLDIGVQLADGTEKFYEIKPKNKLVKNLQGDLAPKNWDQIQAWGQSNGWNIEFLTDEDLSQSKYTIYNWRALLPYVVSSRKSSDATLAFEIYQAIGAGEGVTTQELTQRISTTSIDRVTHEVANLLHRGKIKANLDKAIFSLCTPLHTKSNETN